MKLINFKKKFFNEYEDNLDKLSELWNWMSHDLKKGSFQYTQIEGDLNLFSDISTHIDVFYSKYTHELVFSLVVYSDNAIEYSNKHIFEENLLTVEIEESDLHLFDLSELRTIFIESNKRLEKFLIEGLQKFIDDNINIEE